MNKFTLASLILLPITLNPLLTTNSYHQAENITNQNLIIYETVYWDQVSKDLPTFVDQIIKKIPINLGSKKNINQVAQYVIKNVQLD